MMGRPYLDPAGMRTALERRLRDRHESTFLPLDRLRKEAALQRLLARIVVTLSYPLRGGQASPQPAFLACRYRSLSRLKTVSVARPGSAAHRVMVTAPLRSCGCRSTRLRARGQEARVATR